MAYVRKHKQRGVQKTLWMSEEEKEILEAVAEKTGMNESDVLRAALRLYASGMMLEVEKIRDPLAQKAGLRVPA